MKYNNKKSSKKYNKKSSKKYNKKYTKKFSKKGGVRDFFGRFTRRRRWNNNLNNRPNLPVPVKQDKRSSASSVSILQNKVWEPEVAKVMDMGFRNEEDIRLALYHSDKDVNMVALILTNLPRLIEMGFTNNENSIIALINSDYDVERAVNLLLTEDILGSSRNFTNDEADDFLNLVEKNIGRIDVEMRNNVKRYLIRDDYNDRDHTSMFGSPAEHKYGLGIFWSYFVDKMNSKPNSLIRYSYEYNGIRFANNNGPSFRDDRKEALEMFRMAYNRIKKV
tara:strand:+ start:214 stop:1047 length:834 start_codon:yes stop_codon:yes gene_type:complete